MSVEPEYSSYLWERALKSIGTAEKILEDDSDAAANRAYYAAFYAVSALFATEGHFFKKHAGVQSELHRQMIHTKRMSRELGDDYDKLLALRTIADYGAANHVTPGNARLCIERARRILEAVHKTLPDVFPLNI